MARQARRQSESGIYHVMIRGVNRQPIFGDDHDNLRFLDILKTCKEISGFQLYGYCLMGNHVHLLIKEGEESLGQIMKRICNRYIYWFNLYNDRVGHLLQDRFKSEPVDDDEYFLTVLRYIHQNPLKAGLCNKFSEYKWSSYHDYKANKQDGLTDIAFALDIAPLGDLLEFFGQTNDDKCIEDLPEDYVKTPEHKEMLYREISGCETAQAFQDLGRQQQKNIILACRQRGLSFRALEAFTGVGRAKLQSSIK